METVTLAPAADATIAAAATGLAAGTATARTKEGLPVVVETARGTGPDWRDGAAFAAHYRDEGYAVARGLIPAADAAAVIDAFRAEVKPHRGPLLRQLTTRMEEHRFSADGFMTNTLLSVQDLTDPGFAGFRDASLAVLTHGRVQEVLAGLAGEAVACVESMYFESSARGTITHPDSHFMDASVPGALIGAWFALEDIDPGAGRFYLLPRSQHLGTDAPPFAHLRAAWEAYEALAMRTAGTFTANTEAENAALRVEHGRVLARTLAGIPFLAPMLEAGDVVLWGSRVLHGSLKPTAPGRSRNSLTAHYVGRSHAHIRCGAQADLLLRPVNGMPVQHQRPVRGGR